MFRYKIEKSYRGKHPDEDEGHPFGRRGSAAEKQRLLDERAALIEYYRRKLRYGRG